MKKTNITTFLIIITAIMCGALHSQAQTKEAYAVKNDSTLTFYYDTHRTSRNGIKYDMPAASDDAPVWTGSGMCYNTDIKRAVFDVSFKEFRLTSTYDWFAYCSTLKEIIGIEYLNTEDVSDMSKMFSGCFSLISIDLSNFNTKKVTDMSEMFYCCEALTSLDVSSFNTENVTSMYGMFNSCNALKALNLSNFNTGKVTNMNAMFYCCYS
ncbi:BspA family leucine-rich repeat surface protein, partial [Prevotella koreensis]|uniref:BspA family leucine-rich repeat surface protein n=1 Tax=Prevotella koreensis TaxID=2490854 RepID=UPI0028F0D7F1